MIAGARSEGGLAVEVAGLRRGMRDLMGLLAMSIASSGPDAGAIAGSSLDILVASIPFAGWQLHGKSRHICAFFNSDDEEYRVLLPFIKDGFERGDRAVHVVDPARRTDHLRRLEAAGIDWAAAQRTGQLELRSNAETYLRDGRFDKDRMVEVFERFASGGARSAFPVSRIVCHMDWAVEDRSHLDALVEFESRVNDVWARHDDAVICVYDLSKFGGATVLDMVRTHPLVIIGAILQQNPFFVPPDEFLRERNPQHA